MLYLDALARARKAQEKSKLPPMEVHVLNWPIWINSGDMLDFSMANFTPLPPEPKLEDPIQVFVKQLSLAYEAIGGSSPLQEYWNKLDTFNAIIPLKTRHTKDEALANKTAKNQRIASMSAQFSPYWRKICLQTRDETTDTKVAWLLAISPGSGTAKIFMYPINNKPRIQKVQPTEVVADPSLELPAPEGPKPTINKTASLKRRAEADVSPEDPDQEAKKAKGEGDPNAMTMEEQQNTELMEVISDTDEEAGYLTKALIEPQSNTETDDVDDSESLTEGGDSLSVGGGGGGDGGDMVDQKVETKVSKLKLMEPQPELVKTKLVESKMLEITTVGSEQTHSTPVEPKLGSVDVKAPSAAVISQDSITRVLPIRLGSEKAAIEPSSTASAEAGSPAFYLCGADFPSFSPGDNEAPLEPSPFNDFVSVVSSGYLAVVSGLQSGSAAVHPADEWMQRLSRNGIGIQEIDVVGKIDGQFARITEVRATVKFLETTLRFSSNSSRLVSFPPPASTATPQLSDAFLPTYNLMGLGLETNNTSFTVIDILSTFGMPWLKNASGVFSLPGFDMINDLKVTLDSTAGSRSSLSFRPNVVYSTWLRLKFLIGDINFPATFKDRFPFLGEFTLNNACLVGLNTGDCGSGAPAGDITSQIGFETIITINTATPLSIQVFVIFGYATTTFKVRFVGKDTEDNVSQVIEWLAGVVGLAASDKDQLDPKSLLSNTDASKITLGVHQISLTLNNPIVGTSFSVAAAVIDFEVGVYGSLFNVELSWPPSQIKASLWTDILPDPTTYALLPYVETYNYFTPVNTPSGEVNLGHLGTGAIPLPPDPMNLNLNITELSFLASKDQNGDVTIKFNGVLGSKQPTGAGSVPKLVLGDLDLYLSYATKTGYEIALSTSIYLIPRDFPDEGAGIVNVSIDFTDSPSGAKNWKVLATTYDIKFSTLYYLFDSESNDAVMDMLQNFVIPEIYVEWDYSRGEADLYITGVLQIGPFELDMNYQYLNGGGAGKSTWSFEASLGTNKSDGYKLADLLSDLGADANVTNAIAEVPFVNKIEIPAATPMDGSDPPVKVHISKGDGGVHIFWIQIAITTNDGTLSFTFVQYQGARGPPSDGTSGTTPPKGYKRIIRVMLDKLPSIPSIPVVGQIDQPVDSIDYIWIGDSTVDSTAAGPAGFTATEIEIVNATMTGDNQIPFKDTKSDLQSNSPGNSGAVNKDPYVLLAGHHFIVVAEHVVVLDYIFGGKKTTPEPAPAPAPPESLKAAAPLKSALVKSSSDSAAMTVTRTTQKRVVLADPPAPEEATQADSGATKGAFKKSLGPLTIQSVSVSIPAP